MAAEVRVLVTRPAGQADALIASLEQRGFSAEHLPMLQIEAINPLPGVQRQRILDLDRYQHLIFISANAARIGLECIDDHWPQRPVGQRYWAVGESTAQVLEAAGLEVTRPADDMSSEGLLALPGLASIRDQRILIVKGEGGRGFLEEQLRARGALVEALICYRRAAAAHDGQACRGRLFGQRPVQLVMVSSGEGLELLSGLLQPGEHTNLAQVTLLVPSPRVADQALQLGWKRVECAENASDSAMLAAAEKWRETHLGEVQH
jgi:uroporphyrinogen-III synthase